MVLLSQFYLEMPGTEPRAFSIQSIGSVIELQPLTCAVDRPPTLQVTIGRASLLATSLNLLLNIMPMLRWRSMHLTYALYPETSAIACLFTLAISESDMEMSKTAIVLRHLLQDDTAKVPKQLFYAHPLFIIYAQTAFPPTCCSQQKCMQTSSA